MNEKVLGFYEKDSDKFMERLNFPAEITIDENKLVPVVSVEELEEWVDEHLDACAGVDASDLVEWAKQKAVEEKE